LSSGIFARLVGCRGRLPPSCLGLEGRTGRQRLCLYQTRWLAGGTSGGLRGRTWLAWHITWSVSHEINPLITRRCGCLGARGGSLRTSEWCSLSAINTPAVSINYICSCVARFQRSSGLLRPALTEQSSRQGRFIAEIAKFYGDFSPLRRPAPGGRTRAGPPCSGQGLPHHVGQLQAAQPLLETLVFALALKVGR
jgi:hypothetical protein